MNLSFTVIDFLVVAIIIASAGYAAWRGFLSETLSIFAWAAAAFACLYFGPWLIPMARSMINAPWAASVAAYAGVFLVVFIPLSFMSHRFSQSVKNSPIGPLDRALGVAFGVVRGLLIVGLAYLAFTYFTPVRQQPAWLLDARTLPLMQSTGEVLLSLVPNHGRGELADSPDSRDDLGSLIRRQDDRNGDAAPRDSLGSLIQRQNEDANRLPAEHRGNAKKGYGAGDRRALDRLMETTGSSKP